MILLSLLSERKLHCWKVRLLADHPSPMEQGRLAQARLPNFHVGRSWTSRRHLINISGDVTHYQPTRDPRRCSTRRGHAIRLSPFRALFLSLLGRCNTCNPFSRSLASRLRSFERRAIRDNARNDESFIESLGDPLSRWIHSFRWPFFSAKLASKEFAYKT